MSEIKIKSYKDCAWYLPHIDKCKLPGVGKRFTECSCKDGELNPFCIRVTKLIKSIPDDIEMSDGDNEYYSITNDYLKYKQEKVVFGDILQMLGI